MTAEGSATLWKSGICFRSPCRRKPCRPRCFWRREWRIVGQLAGGVVHDFNNILSVIAGTIEILAEAVRKADLANMIRAAPAPDSIVVNVELT